MGRRADRRADYRADCGGRGVGSLNHITLVETISWKWNQFWRGTIPGLIVALIIGLIGGLISGSHIKEGPIVGLIGGLILGVIFGLVSGLVGGMTDTVKVGKAFPNEGIKLSVKNSLAVVALYLNRRLRSQGIHDLNTAT